jgi:hypothetical protein
LKIPSQLNAISIILLLGISLFSISILPIAEAQTIINVTEVTPCFMNYTPGANIWKNCGAKDDFIAFALLPWEWITGGWFSMIFVSLIVAFSYIKYHKVIYPMIVGMLYLPFAYFLFPNQFIIAAFVLVGAAIGIIGYNMYMRRTEPYN